MAHFRSSNTLKYVPVLNFALYPYLHRNLGFLEVAKP